MTMQVPTLQPQLWPSLVNPDWECLPIHLTVQIWHHVITFCFHFKEKVVWQALQECGWTATRSSGSVEANPKEDLPGCDPAASSALVQVCFGIWRLLRGGSHWWKFGSCGSVWLTGWTRTARRNKQLGLWSVMSFVLSFLACNYFSFTFCPLLHFCWHVCWHFGMSFLAFCWPWIKFCKFYFCCVKIAVIWLSLNWVIALQKWFLFTQLRSKVSKSCVVISQELFSRTVCERPHPCKFLKEKAGHKLRTRVGGGGFAFVGQLHVEFRVTLDFWEQKSRTGKLQRPFTVPRMLLKRLNHFNCCNFARCGSCSPRRTHVASRTSRLANTRWASTCPFVQ